MEDPRCNQRNLIHYSVSELFFLVISAVICGFDDWKAIALFGKEEREWLRKFFAYEKGTPCATTLSRFFAKLNPEEFSQLFSQWVVQLSNNITTGKVVAIDGKTLRGSVDKSHDKAALHIISAFICEQELTLGQLATEEKSNEITAIPKLLDIITLDDCIVTIDAMGCQKAIARKIVKANADYILQVKNNQKTLLEQIEKVFEITNLADTHTSYTLDHGRIEQRTCQILTDLNHMDDCSDWQDLRTLIRIQSSRTIKATGKTETSTRYYISSREDGAQHFNQYIRSHWAIENKLHWSLDVTFKEDSSKKRVGNSAHNFNIITKIAMTMINDVKIKGLSKPKKRVKAVLNKEFRELLLKI